MTKNAQSRAKIVRSRAFTLGFIYNYCMQEIWIDDTVGNTPLVMLRRLGRVNNNRILLKMEGDNPAGSVKDRPARNMILRAAARGDIHLNDRLIEATSGNTGIALAMMTAALGYRMRLIMPANQTEERKQSMRAYGAELIIVTREEGMEGARDLAMEMVARGEGFMLNQFANPDNPAAHYMTTAPEIWRDTDGAITHFVSSMGTTGTITGCSRYFADNQTGVEVIGVHPAEGAQIAGIRKWAEAYIPKIYDPTNINRIIEVTQSQAEETTRELARREGIFCGVSSGGALWVALQLAQQCENATIVSIACDRGDRYLSSGVYS